MQHTIQLDQLGPAGEPMARAIQTCVHCGFCLPACPTYQVLGQEMDSPRGRIYLMKQVLENQVPLEDALPHIDRCLGCLGCVTACPSGVEYGELISPFRDLARTRRKRSVMEKLKSMLILGTLPYPGRFRMAAMMGRLARPFKGLMPRSLRPMLDMLPASIPKAQKLREINPAIGPRRTRVALLAGCAQQVLAPEINAATIRVLNLNGVEVVIPRDQGCCGALAWHVGQADAARAHARRNLAAFGDGVDAIISNAAGCGSGMHEYPLMFSGMPERPAAEAFAGRVKDVSAFLVELGFSAPPPLKSPLTLAYHDACHLHHAQKIHQQPRKLLEAIGNLTLAPIPDGEICCGSAGTYNVDQPEIAASLGQSKAKNIRTTGAQAVAAGNIGCLVQIRTHLAGQPNPPPVLHTMQILAAAYEQVELRNIPGA